jgi:hypothetical protein
VKPTRGSSRSPTGGVRHRDDEFMWRQVRVTDAKLDALIARGYLAAVVNPGLKSDRCASSNEDYRRAARSGSKSRRADLNVSDNCNFR